MTRLLTYMELLETFDIEIKENPVQSLIAQLQKEGAQPETIMDLINCVETAIRNQ